MIYCDVHAASLGDPRRTSIEGWVIGQNAILFILLRCDYGAVGRRAKGPD